MKNLDQVRDRLSTIFDQLESGEIDAKKAAEFANLAGKMINSAKVQVEYYALKKEVPSISFLDSQS
jgi:hypothetical protein